MNDKTHIIHRVNLEIDVPEMRLANKVKDDALRLLYNEVLPKLEKYMDSLIPEDEYIRLERLNIDIGQLSEAHFDEEFTKSVVQRFHEKAEKIVAPVRERGDQTEAEKVERFTKEESACECFLFFLETGSLPWWSQKSGELLGEKNLSEALKKSSVAFQKRLFSLFGENPVASQRLLNQFSLPFIFQSVLVFVAEEPTRRIIRLLQQFIVKKVGDDTVLDKTQLAFSKEIIFLLLARDEVFSGRQLAAIIDEDSSKATLHDIRFSILLEDLKSNITPFPEKIRRKSGFQETKEDKKVVGKKQKKREVEEEGLFVDNAGLVLLHPFLSSLFTDFELLAEGQFKDSESQTIAVHLLHYLATKQEFAAEHELAMEQFLCGWDSDWPIEREVALSREMKNECETLLTAAIGHWSALKNTSPDGLREGFLQREGKLILNDFQDRLIVESKTHDVLLSYLPWGYSIFKLSWMKSALYVEWG